MVRVLSILWFSKYMDGSRIIDTLVFQVFWWFAYYWYFGIPTIWMVRVLLILSYSKYSDFVRTINTLVFQVRTIDTLIFQVFLFFAYYWYFGIPSTWMVRVLWYFDILSIWMVRVLLIPWYWKYVLMILWHFMFFDGWRNIGTLVFQVFRRFAYYWYLGILSIWMVLVLLILWYSKYLDVLRTKGTLVF